MQTLAVYRHATQLHMLLYISAKCVDVIGPNHVV